MGGIYTRMPSRGTILWSFVPLCALDVIAQQHLRDRAACTKTRFYSPRLTSSGRPAPPGRTPSELKPALEAWKPRRGWCYLSEGFSPQRMAQPASGVGTRI